MGWDEVRQRTVVQRYKESAEEYRYFPEPDLPIIEVSREWVSELRAQLPELPDAKRARFERDFELSRQDASVLTADRATADYYERALATGANAKSAANWMTGALFSLLNAQGVDRADLSTFNIQPAQFGGLVKLVDSGAINKATGVTVLAHMAETGDDAETIVAAKGLAQISDTSVVDGVIAQVLADHESWVQDYLGGKDKVFGALMGKVMAALRGQGNPAVVRESLARALEEKRG
jgi:aspartyl-tRNA(Asn)/glutamyl-tRNA(Gln) amidotransferase subunit B